MWMYLHYYYYFFCALFPHSLTYILILGRKSLPPTRKFSILSTQTNGMNAKIFYGCFLLLDISPFHSSLLCAFSYNFICFYYHYSCSYCLLHLFWNEKKIFRCRRKNFRKFFNGRGFFLRFMNLN